MKVSSNTLLPIIGFILLNVFFTIPYAEAGFCPEPEAEVGNWVNNDPNTRGVTRVNITSRCVDAPIRQCNGDICSIVHNVKRVYDIQVWGSCSPSDCYWGKVEGVETSANWMRFFYNFSFANKWVWAKNWEGSDDWLRVVVDTRYKDNREDRVVWEWFRRN